MQGRPAQLAFLTLVAAIACQQSAPQAPSARRAVATLPPGATDAPAAAGPDAPLVALEQWITAEVADIQTSLFTIQTPHAESPPSIAVPLERTQQACAPADATDMTKWDPLAQALVLPMRRRDFGELAFHPCDGKNGPCVTQVSAPCRQSPFAIVRDVDAHTEATWLVRTTSPFNIVRSVTVSDAEVPLRWVGAADLDGDGELDFVLQSAATHAPCGEHCDFSSALAAIVWNGLDANEATVQTLPQRRYHEDHVFLAKCGRTVGLAVHEESGDETGQGRPPRAYSFRGRNAVTNAQLSACIFELQTRRSKLQLVLELLRTCKGSSPELPALLKALAHPAATDASWQERLEQRRSRCAR